MDIIIYLEDTYPELHLKEGSIRPAIQGATVNETSGSPNLYKDDFLERVGRGHYWLK